MAKDMREIVRRGLKKCRSRLSEFDYPAKRSSNLGKKKSI